MLRMCRASNLSSGRLQGCTNCEQRCRLRPLRLSERETLLGGGQPLNSPRVKSRSVHEGEASSQANCLLLYNTTAGEIAAAILQGADTPKRYPADRARPDAPSLRTVHYEASRCLWAPVKSPKPTSATERRDLMGSRPEPGKNIKTRATILARTWN